VRGQFLRTIPSKFLFELGTNFIEQVRHDDIDDDIDLDDDNDYDTSSQDVPRFKKGQLVRHEKFGLGRIKDFVDMGENSVVVVKFNSGQTKTLMLKYANLSDVDI